jgi:hypothetical protein
VLNFCLLAETRRCVSFLPSSVALKGRPRLELEEEILDLSKQLVFSAVEKSLAKDTKLIMTNLASFLKVIKY